MDESVLLRVEAKKEFFERSASLESFSRHEVSLVGDERCATSEYIRGGEEGRASVESGQVEFDFY